MLLLSICKNLSQYMLTRKAKNSLGLLYCWHSCTGGTLVLLGILYCWHSCTVGTLVLLALLYCWHSCTVGTLVLLGLLCACVFTLFHLLVSSGCTISVIHVRSPDQRSFVVSIFWVLLRSSFISISESILFHPQRRKLQPTAYWRENDMI